MSLACTYAFRSVQEHRKGFTQSPRPPSRPPTRPVTPCRIGASPSPARLVVQGRSAPRRRRSRDSEAHSPFTSGRSPTAAPCTPVRRVARGPVRIVPASERGQSRACGVLHRAVSPRVATRGAKAGSWARPKKTVKYSTASRGNSSAPRRHPRRGRMLPFSCCTT